MRRLLPPESAGEMTFDELLDEFSFPATSPPQSWVRSVFVSSVDGGATGNDGVSGSLSSDHDSALFLHQRQLSDVILVGAGTARNEGYGPVVAKPDHARRRRELGQRDAPVLCLVSSRLDLDPTDPLFTSSTERIIVATHSEASWERVEQIGEVADVIRTPGPTVDLGSLLATLADRGLTRVDCEGGPTLHGTLVAQGLLDELVLTMAPRLVGGGVSRRITAGDALTDEYPMTLTGLVQDDDGSLFMTWRRLRD